MSVATRSIEHMFEAEPLGGPAPKAGRVRHPDPGFDDSFDRVDRVVALEREIARLQAEQALEVAAHAGDGTHGHW